MKKILLIIILTNYLFAGCSSYINKITINEVYHHENDDNVSFIEIATVDGTAFKEEWALAITGEDGETHIIDINASGCDDDDYASTVVDRTLVDFSGKKVSISLRDSNDTENFNYIDYLVINGDSEGNFSECSYTYDTNLTYTKGAADSNSWDAYRDEDITGDWEAESSMMMGFMGSTDKSECETNGAAGTIYVNDDGDANDDDDTDCDEPNFNTINDALTKIRDGSDDGAKVIVCSGDYDENLIFDDENFNNFTLKGKGVGVNIKSDENVLVSINNEDIENITFKKVNFIHDVSCDNGCSNDSKFLFDFKKNKHTAESKINLINLPIIDAGSCNAFNKFSTDTFHGKFNFFGLKEFKSGCSAVKVNECDKDKDSFHFNLFNFKLTSKETDQFGIYFGDNVSDECNVSMKNISLDMNQSSGGIRFKELGNFTFEDDFTFKNIGTDTTNSAFEAELKGSSYNFSSFNINNSGKAFDFTIKNHDAEINFGNDDSNSTMVSRDSDGLIMSKIKKAKFHNIMMESDGKGLELDIDGDLNVTGVILKSNGCGFELKHGNPMFNRVDIKANQCDYSFKKSGDGINSTGFILKSTFGLIKTGTDTYPLDWEANNYVDLNDSCFCPKKKSDEAAINRSRKDYNFTTHDNFWKYGTSSIPDGFDDDNPKSSCPEEYAFQDACAKDIISVSNFIIYNINYRDNNISDSNLTTKKVNVIYNDINISSINSDDETQVIDFNGTLCFKIVATDSTNEMEWTKVDVREANTTNIEFNSTFSSHDATITFNWEKDSDTECEDMNSSKETNSSEHFSIIPTKFLIGINETKLRAGLDYTLEVNATDSSNKKINTYSQYFNADGNDSNISVYFIPNDITKTKEFNTSFDFNITNGTGSKNDFNISDVGKYFIKIIDTTYATADIDDNDTDLKDRTIEGNITILVIPHHFDLNITTHKASTNQDWAYMAQDFESDMNYTIRGTLTAKNEANETTLNYDKDEYAYDINTSITFDTNLTNQDENITKIYKKGNELNTTKENFNKGISEFYFIYRMDKNITKPFRPIRTNIKNIDINKSSDEKNIMVNGVHGNIDDNITWYYSRVEAYPITSYSEDSVNNHFYILVYKEDTKPNYKEYLIDWYNNGDDSITKFENSDFIPTKDTSISNTTDPKHTITVLNSTKNGKVNFKIKRNNGDDSDSATIHIKTPKYLWYLKYRDTKYNDDNNSRCSSHTCVNYTYIKSGNNISTGKYTGGDIDVKDRNYTKKGIKVFR